jgi:hypothetical protein
LSQRLRTPSLPTTHALVGYWWQNTRLYPLFVKVITATHATSCRTPTPGSAAPPQKHHLPGQDRLNNQHLLRPKTAAAVALVAPFVGRVGPRPLPAANFADDTAVTRTTSLTNTTTSLRPCSDWLRVLPTQRHLQPPPCCPMTRKIAPQGGRLKGLLGALPASMPLPTRSSAVTDAFNAILSNFLSKQLL